MPRGLPTPSEKPTLFPRTILTVELLEDRQMLSANPLLIDHDPLIHIAELPNDPSFAEQYALENEGQSNGTIDADIDAATAWDISTGSHEILIGVIDTGIDYRHEDLYRNIWINQEEIPDAILPTLTDIDDDGLITFVDLNASQNQGVGKITDLNANGYIDGGDILQPFQSDGRGGWANGISEDGDEFTDDLIGWNFVENTNVPWDDHGHGTHVAGLLGAMGDNGVGVTGILWDVQLAAIKFLDDDGRGFTSDAIDAFHYALDKGIPISNNSWSLSSFSQPLEDAISEARIQGHIVVAAAGNQSSDLDVTPRYPVASTLDNVVAVGATSRRDKITTFSNYGTTTVDLFAPGLHVLSTRPNDRYVTKNGTSMATPHVTATLAMVQHLRPEWSHQQVIQQVFDTVDPLERLEGKGVTEGRLNFGRAITDLGVATTSMAGDGPSITSLFLNGTGVDPVSRVRVFFDKSIDPTTFTHDDVQIVGPDGEVAIRQIRFVSNSDGQKVDLFFQEEQATPGNYSISIGPDIRDLDGNPLADGVYTSSFRIKGGATFTKTEPLSLIRDNSTTISVLNIDENLTINDIVVRVDLEHTAVGDLLIELLSPQGDRIILANHRGGSGDHFDNTTFDDEASRSIAKGRAPFKAHYRPDEKLSQLQGISTAGTWQLRITDTQSGNEGQLHSWKLFIEDLGGIAAASAGGSANSSQSTIQIQSGSPSEDQTVHDIDTLFSAGMSLNNLVDESEREIVVETVSEQALVQNQSTMDDPLSDSHELETVNESEFTDEELLDYFVNFDSIADDGLTLDD